MSEEQLKAKIGELYMVIERLNHQIAQYAAEIKALRNDSDASGDEGEK